MDTPTVQLNNVNQQEAQVANDYDPIKKPIIDALIASLISNVPIDEQRSQRMIDIWMENMQ